MREAIIKGYQTKRYTHNTELLYSLPEAEKVKVGNYHLCDNFSVLRGISARRSPLCFIWIIPEPGRMEKMEEKSDFTQPLFH